ncbi:MAG: RNA polymerase sigma factor [Planctomycetaceae bacterium]|nr:RNA polymerase sigma factor [Planctomycetaceae bacterium]
MNEDEREVLFNAWVGQHLALVGRVARSYVDTEEDCQDLVQEILLQVWFSIPQFERKAKPSTWIYRVALNTAFAWQRRNERQRRRQFQPLVWDIDAAKNETDQAHQRERIERLHAAIRQLPKADAAMVLLYLDDLSYREIAEILGISEVNVGVKLNRARKALAELMKEEIAHDS